MSDLTKAERDDLLARAFEMEARLYPEGGAEPPPVEQRARIREQFYVMLGEYSDRLPRIPLSACPHCGVLLKRAFDPFGLDGPWWFTDLIVKFEEPRACEHFRVLLGALDLRGRDPVEATSEVRPGPEVPFVVPALLDHAGMIAVVGKTALVTGDVAYPIAYFSEAEVEPIDLHQPWCRAAYWFTGSDGKGGWAVANDVWDFDLAHYVVDGRFRWVDLDEDDPKVRGGEDGPCPLLDLPGERRPQQVAGGRGISSHSPRARS